MSKPSAEEIAGSKENPIAGSKENPIEATYVEPTILAEVDNNVKQVTVMPSVVPTIIEGAASASKSYGIYKNSKELSISVHEKDLVNGEYIQVSLPPMKSPIESKDELHGKVEEASAENEKTPLVKPESPKTFSDRLQSLSLEARDNKWSSGIFGLCAHLSHILGPSNLIHFPYLCGQHGGAAFLIPYICAYIFVGIPMLYAEMVLGQFSSLPPVEIFRRMSPALAGLAVAMLITTVYRSLYYSAIISQLLYAGAISLQGFWTDVPGSICDQESRTTLCREPGYQKFCLAFSNCPRNRLPHCSWNATEELLFPHSNQTHMPSHHYYMTQAVFKPAIESDDLQFPPIVLTAILFFVWTAVAGLSYYGIKNMGKVFVALKIVCIGVVVVNMIVGLNTSVKDGNGMSFFFNPNFRSLLKMEAWSDAISHVLFSLSLGDSTIHTISALNDFNENFLFNALIISAADIILSVCAGVTFFSAVGSVSANLYGTALPRERIQRTLMNGFAFSMTAFPEHAISSMHKTWATLSSSAHYFALAKLGLANLVLYCSFAVSAISSSLAYFYDFNKPLIVKVSITASVALFCFFSSIIFVAPGGIYISYLVAEFTNASLLVICLAEIIVLVHGYGFRRFLVNVETMLANENQELNMSISSIGIWYYFLTPVFLVVAIFLKLFYNSRLIMNGYQFPMSFELFGWFISITCVIMIPITLLSHMFVVKFKPGMIANTFEPTCFWGPAHLQDRERNMKKERAIRVRKFFSV